MDEPLRLRTGRRNPHTLYQVHPDGTETPAGFALTADLAQAITEAVDAHADEEERR